MSNRAVPPSGFLLPTGTFRPGDRVQFSSTRNEDWRLISNLQYKTGIISHLGSLLDPKNIEFVEIQVLYPPDLIVRNTDKVGLISRKQIRTR